MTAKTSQNQTNRNDDIEARVGLLEYQFREVGKALSRIENKQDAAIRQIDTLKYVSTHEFDQFAKDVAKTYASAATVRWLLGLVGGVFVGVTLAIVGVILR